MTYNIHPIFVHFPIALLFVYSIIKILPLKKWFPSVAWKDIERTLLVFGVLGAFATLYTGSIASHLVVGVSRQLIRVHSTFAMVATWAYGILLFGEAVIFIHDKKYFQNYKFIMPAIEHTANTFNDRWFATILTLFALASLSLAGLLGGVIVYGFTADPFASMVVKFLGISY